MNQLMRNRAGLLLTCAVCCLIVFVAFSQQEEKAAVDPDVYKAFMAAQVSDVYALEKFFWEQRDPYIDVLPPDPEFILRQPGSPAILPFEPKDFPTEFVENLSAVYENSVPVYPITILEDPKTRETVFLNADGKEIYSLPPVDDYDPFAYLKWRYPDLYSGLYSQDWIAYLESLYDPARIQIQVKLIPVEYVEPYLYAAAQVAESQAELSASSEGEGGGGMMLLWTEDWTNHIWMELIRLGLGQEGGVTGSEIIVHLPDEFTNGIEIFTFDANSNNTFKGVASDWLLGATNDNAAATNLIIWDDINISTSESRFYVTAADVDSDSDGLTDGREKYIIHSDPGVPDTDGDGFTDGDEVNIYGTDPTDKYSVPPPPMLQASGKYIVDEDTNRVVLKSVNIGGWLQWEQWMLMFEPRIITNDLGEVVDSHMDEATARDLMIGNVDYAVNLKAAEAPLKYGVNLQTSGTLVVVGDFDKGDWIAFTNVDFGDGVSNLAVGLAVDNANAGHGIEVRLDGTNGTLVGTITAEETGGWYDWAEMALSGISVSGTHDVYFVATETNDIANLYSFRFYRDNNTTNLFEVFRDNYFKTNDLDAIKALGYNCIRLPFFYNLLEDDGNAYTYKTSGWQRLDWAVEECRKRRLWVILDLHGTPGGQNTYHASGLKEPFRNRMWKSEYFKDRTEKLWAEIAARYATNSAVAGYDLFNEPDAPRWWAPITNYYQAFTNYIVPMLTRLHRAIRSNDTEHILFMEGNMMYTNMWDDVFWWPSPTNAGWTNVCYQFHVYDQVVYGQNTNDDWYFTTQKGICDNMIRAFTRLSDNRQVPVYVGEFAPWDEHNMDYWIRQCEANDLHWGHWNYRSWGWDDPTQTNKGRTIWGLDYRSEDNKDLVPNLQTDLVTTLEYRLGLYNRDNYSSNAYLQDVVENNTLSTNPARERCGFYVNGFSAQNAVSLADAYAWPWKKLVTYPTNQEAFWIQQGKAQLRLAWSPIRMRFKSREEVDARFEVGDATGCKFSLDVSRFGVQSQVAGPEAAVNLCVVRDEVTSPVTNYDTKGVIARLEYDDNTTNVTLYLYAKDGGTNTLGTLKGQVNGVPFVTNGTGTLELFVNATTAVLKYAGTEYTNVAHGLNLGAWPNGAVCVIEAQDLASGGAVYTDMDNFRAERPSAAKGQEFTDDFTAYPEGIMVRAEPEGTSIRSWWSTIYDTESYVTNGSLLWIPQDVTNGGSWYNPRANYQNDARYNLSPTNVVEVRLTYSDFTNGTGKICMMPEYFPGEVFNQYKGEALYLELSIRPPGHSAAGHLAFDLYTHHGPNFDRDWEGYNEVFPFENGQTVSFQVSTNYCRFWYGTNVIVNQWRTNSVFWTNHLVGAASVYSNGVFPHLEYQNPSSTSNATVRLNEALCRQLSGFTAP